MGNCKVINELKTVKAFYVKKVNPVGRTDTVAQADLWLCLMFGPKTERLNYAAKIQVCVPRND
jgi:hypothetical protein